LERSLATLASIIGRRSIELLSEITLISIGYLSCFVAAALLSMLLTRWVRKVATVRGWVKVPELDRHVHTRPVPMLGGVAIYISFMAVSAAVLVVPRWLGFPSAVPLMKTFGILGPGLIIFLLGLYDDLHSIGPYRKFGVQAVAAVFLYLSGFGIHQLDLFSAGHILQAAVGLPLTILWVLLITNAFNLIDGLDGLAAGSALFSTVVVLAISLLIPNPIVTGLTIALAGAILGFLRFNFYPASIFLGDSGSLFVGFMLSALALAGSQKAPTMVAVAIPVVSFGLPILDVALAIVRRFVGGRPLFSGDNDHIHHRLLKRGLSQRESVLVLYAATAGFALLSLFLIHDAGLIALVLVVIGIGVWVGVQHLHYAEFAELQDLVRRTKKRKQLIAHNLEIRRASEMLNSCADFTSICKALKNALQPVGFDGFQLKNSPTSGISESFFSPLRRAPDGGLQYFWCDITKPDAAWELRLELIMSSGYRMGYFSLFRMQVENPLVVDVDLFNHEFRNALSNALFRAMNQIRTAESTEAHEVSLPTAPATSISTIG
jgi:UDP-GlcNAc:undecaprenyl-phosphate/decaprenyl-phosphate GlcNAc-1-phosphate transferase